MSPTPFQSPNMEFIVRISPRKVNPKSSDQSPTLMVDVYWEQHHGVANLPLALKSYDRTNAAEIRWYIEDYAATDPFDRTRADKAKKSLMKDAETIGGAILSAVPLEVPDHSNILLQVEFGPHNATKHDFCWELLQDTAIWEQLGRSFSNVRVIRCSVPEPTGNIRGIFEASKKPRALSQLSILIVVARPGAASDINHRLVSKPLVDTLGKVHERVGNISLDFVRPATWEKFVDTLEEAHKKGKRYDIVHFDAHGMAEGDESFLCFVKSASGGSKRISAATIADTLRKYKVSIAILNACESAARTTAGESLAEIFVSRGLNLVVAMAFKVLDSAAELFMTEIYLQFLLSQNTFTQAVFLGSQKLLQKPSRRARFGCSVDVADFAVPILLCRDGWDVKFTNQKPKASVGFFKKLRDLFKHKLSPKDLFGRDGEILELENLILQGVSCILIHGTAGVGKSDLTQYLMWWWGTTGFVDHTLHLDFDGGMWLAYDAFAVSIRRAGGVMTNFDDLEGALEFLCSNRCLIVVDSLEVVTESQVIPEDGIETDEIFLQEEKAVNFWKKFFKELSKPKSNSIVLATSRGKDCRLLPKKSTHRFSLEGFDLETACSFGSAIMSHHGTDLSVHTESKLLREHLESTIELCEGLPGLLELLFPLFRTSDASQAVKILHKWILGETVLELHNIKNPPRFIQSARDIVDGLKSFRWVLPKYSFALGGFLGAIPFDLKSFSELIQIGEKLNSVWIKAPQFSPVEVSQQYALNKSRRSSKSSTSSDKEASELQSVMEAILALSQKWFMAFAVYGDDRTLVSYNIHPALSLTLQHATPFLERNFGWEIVTLMTFRYHQTILRGFSDGGIPRKDLNAALEENSPVATPTDWNLIRAYIKAYHFDLHCPSRTGGALSCQDVLFLALMSKLQFDPRLLRLLWGWVETHRQQLLTRLPNIAKETFHLEDKFEDETRLHVLIALVRTMRDVKPRDAVLEDMALCNQYCEFFLTAHGSFDIIQVEAFRLQHDEAILALEVFPPDMDVVSHLRKCQKVFERNLLKEPLGEFREWEKPMIWRIVQSNLSLWAIFTSATNQDDAQLWQTLTELLDPNARSEFMVDKIAELLSRVEGINWKKGQEVAELMGMMNKPFKEVITPFLPEDKRDFQHFGKFTKEVLGMSLKEVYKDLMGDFQLWDFLQQGLAMVPKISSMVGAASDTLASVSGDVSKQKSSRLRHIEGAQNNLDLSAETELHWSSMYMAASREEWATALTHLREVRKSALPLSNKENDELLELQGHFEGRLLSLAGC